ncbi:EAL domain-containing protein [Modestobacter sp. NPDC049651]|uniref:putative bifunctional diguanylate cyclase/phosphodiesterase n=1 Tax=unclassified Modestobacter TaxID=2643866 RepID=UPI0033CB17C8
MPRLRRGRLAVCGALGGLVLAALTWTVLTRTGEPPVDAAYLAVSTGAAAAAWWADRRWPQNRRGRHPWVPIALTCTATGDLVWQLTAWTTGSPPDVSVADVSWLASYIALSGVALTGRFGGRQVRGARLFPVLDGLAALSVALLLCWHSSIDSSLLEQGKSTLTRLTWNSLPVLDALMIGLLAWRVVLHGRVRPAAALMLAGVVCWLLGDLGWLLTTPAADGLGLRHAGWLVGITLFAVVPFLPQSRVRNPGALPGSGHGPWRIALNVAPFIGPVLAEVIGWARDIDVNPFPGVVVWTVLLAIATVRTRALALDGERAWAAVRSQARRSDALAAHSSDAVAVVDAAGLLTQDSRTMSDLLGRPAPRGTSLPDLLAAIGVDPADVAAALTRARRDPGAPVELELPGGHAATGPVWLGGRAVDLRQDPDVGGIVVSVYDITARKLAETELAHQAFHDGLTGLANRSLFLDRAEQALRRAGRAGTAPVVLVLDLDGFKDVNDSLGHLVGDELLKVVATRLAGVVRAGDTVARLGGDEFAVLVEDPAGEGPAGVHDLADRLLAVLVTPVDLQGHSVSIAASIGIVTAEPQSTPLSLLQDADIAMYRAKAAGRAQWVLFEPAMRAEALHRIELERELAGALEGCQLRLVYQPVVDLRTEHVVGFEALVRWQHPTLGAVGPDRFVPVAEAAGLIVPIGRWVLAEACATAARWQRAHPGTPLSMAVNVSARQLAGTSFLADVAQALATSGIQPRSLTLEITETALVADPTAVAQRLAELHTLGVRIALDDFGTGYSSLSYLRQFPVDVLKIDRSFVELLSGGGEDAAIVHGLVQLGRTLQLEVVAEGVELPVQRDRLRSERCHLAQGYLFSPPLEAADAELLLLAAGSRAVAPR